MKTNLLSLFLAFLPFSSFAGLPSQDPEVARLQMEFLEAHTPSVEELQLGKDWACAGFNAIKDQMERYTGSDYRFEAYRAADGDSFFLEYYAHQMVLNHQIDASEISFLYRFGNGHFMGNPYFDRSIAQVHSYLRMTVDGRMIVEVATFLNPADLAPGIIEERMSRSVPASLYPELRLMGYEECRVKE